MKEAFKKSILTGTIELNLKERGFWSTDKKTLCDNIVRIVNKYQRSGYKLTLRQLYYQLVSEDLIPNHDTVYKKLSSILDDLRYGGHLDWDAIEDRGRIPYIPYSADNIADAMDDIIYSYKLDRQRDQDVVLEVWTEKDAISAILKRVTSEYHIRLVVNKGYTSSTAMYGAYERFSRYINAGRKVVVLYFGDHDASGLDMIRDIRERIEFFLLNGNQMEVNFRERGGDEDWELYESERWAWLQDLTDACERIMSDDEHEKFDKEYDRYYAGKNTDAFFKGMTPSEWKERRGLINQMFEVKPIGLTMEQIREYNPPENPAKLTDPRAKWYVEQFGEVSWEVDALRPDVMEQLVRSQILELIDIEKYNLLCQKEKVDREIMRTFADSFKNDESGKDEEE